MPFLGSKYAKIAFADPAGGAYSAPPDPLAGLKGPTSKGRGGERREGIGGKGRGMRGEGEVAPSLSQIPGSAPDFSILSKVFIFLKVRSPCRYAIFK